MDAYISSIEFIRKDQDNCFWKVILVDENNNYMATFGDDSITDEINFRRQTFGILSACNCYDLLRLSSENPNPLPIFFSERPYGGINTIVNAAGKSFGFSNKTYGITKVWNFFNKSKKIKDYELGEIESISSGNAILSICVKHEHYMTWYQSGQVYYGFGYPIGIGLDAKEEDIKKSSKHFRAFLEGILELYNTKDLLKLSRKEYINYPKVSITKDEFGNVTSLYNKETGLTLTKDKDSYQISTKELIKDEPQSSNPKVKTIQETIF